MVKENRLIFASAAVLAAKKKREATIAKAVAANPKKFGKPVGFASGSSNKQGYAKLPAVEPPGQTGNITNKDNVPGDTTIPGTEEDVQTPEERAKSQFKGQFPTKAEFGKDFLGLDMPYSTMEEFMDYYKKGKESESEYLKQQNAIASEIEASNMGQAQRSTEGAIAATTAGLAQGREGTVSAGASPLSKQFTGEMERRMSVLRKQRESNMMARQEAERKLKRAHEIGDSDMIEAIQGQISSLESAERQLDIDAMDAAATFETTAMDVWETTQVQNRANLSSFTGMVDSGAIMDTNALIQMSNTLNIPFETANAYYQATEQIRADKSMDAQTKEIELANVKKDFDERVNGIRSKEAQNVADLNTIMQSGNWTIDQINTYAAAMNIPTDQNPYFVLDMKMKAADAKIKEYEANNLGKEPPKGSPEWYDYQMNKLEYQKAQQELVEMVGGFSVSAANEILGATVTQKFDTDIGYNIPGQRDGKHDGLDYVLPGGKGAEVRAPIAGVARIVNDPNPGVNKGWGNQVIITDSQGRDHMFGHLSNINVQNGDVITAGTVIGGQGNTGYTLGKTGIHVDYRIKQDGKYIDPEPFLKNPPTVGGGEDSLSKYKQEYMASGLTPEKATEKAMEKVEDDKKNKMTVDQQVTSNGIAIGTIDKILDNLSMFDTGITGYVAEFLPATDAYDIARDLDTIKAIVGFAKLQEMRNASKTGGALGQVSEMENKLLQSVLGSLDQYTSREKFVGNLEQVKSSLLNINNAAKKDYAEEEANTLWDSIDTESPDDILNQF